MTDLLRAEGVSAFYGASQILFDIDLASSGETHAGAARA